MVINVLIASKTHVYHITSEMGEPMPCFLVSLILEKTSWILVKILIDHDHLMLNRQFHGHVCDGCQQPLEIDELKKAVKLVC